MSEVSHVVRTHHIDTGAIEMMCGQYRDKWEDPDPALPMCGGCAVELVNLLKHRLDDVEGVQRQTRRVFMREQIAQTAEIEELTDEIKGLRKQVKKARKQAETKVS